MCAGAGGQALGFELAGFEHAAVIEIDEEACKTLRFNRPQWNVIRQDLNYFDPSPYSRVDVVAGGPTLSSFLQGGKAVGVSR